MTTARRSIFCCAVTASLALGAVAYAADAHWGTPSAVSDYEAASDAGDSDAACSAAIRAERAYEERGDVENYRFYQVAINGDCSMAHFQGLR